MKEKGKCDRENILDSCVCIVDIYCNVGLFFISSSVHDYILKMEKYIILYFC